MDSIILTTGGTGGHIFPALAVAEELRRRHPGIRILFVGSQYGQEGRLAERAAVPFRGLPVRGVMGRGLRAIPAALGLGAGFIQSLGIIGQFSPQVVAGFGGYASFAPVLAAWTGRRPVLIHEQNAIAGSGNRFLGRLANTVCVSLAGTQGFAGDCVMTGNPVRRQIANIAGVAGRKRAGRRLLIAGGSQGAHSLNEFVAAHLGILAKNGVSILHQCGLKDHAMLEKAYRTHGYDPACVQPFIDDMASAYAWADLALCRSGASTVAELCASGTPAVLVPFPAAIHDHQTINARVLAGNKAAILIPETQLDNRHTVENLLELLERPDRLCRMSAAALAVATPDAAARLADELEKLARGAAPARKH